MACRRLVPVLAILSVFAAVGAQGQTSATCTNFHYFVTPSPYNAAFEATGINHWGTVVGMASSSTVVKGMIRQPGGSIALYEVPGSTYTALIKRNYYGTSVGFYLPTASSPPVGLVLSPSLSHASLKYPGSYATVLTGINKYNVIVGWYTMSATDYQHGFMYQSGHFTSIAFPGAVNTVPTAINDLGVVVGMYVDGNMENPPHGFILKSGTYTSFDAPNGNTQPSDISNTGTIVVGNFLDVAGIWKKITVPNSYENLTYGINDVGTVTGMAVYQTGPTTFIWKGFTASCH